MVCMGLLPSRGEACVLELGSLFSTQLSDVKAPESSTARSFGPVGFCPAWWLPRCRCSRPGTSTSTGCGLCFEAWRKGKQQPELLHCWCRARKGPWRWMSPVSFCVRCFGWAWSSTAGTLGWNPGVLVG